MIWRSCVRTPVGSNFGCIVLLSQVVLEPKTYIISGCITRHRHQADHLLGMQHINLEVGLMLAVWFQLSHKLSVAGFELNGMVTASEGT